MSIVNSQPNPTSPRLRWFQFSLRTLLLFVLLVSIGMSWVAVRMQKAKKQREAVEAIEKLGGAVSYDYQVDQAGQFTDKTEPAGPAWLREVLGQDFFANVVAAQVNTDSGMEKLKAFPHIQSLQIVGAVTDAGMKHVKGLSQLRELLLQGVPITDAGVAHVEDMSELRTLDLAATRITDHGLEHFKGLRQLQLLSIWGNQITDTGLGCLKTLSQLRTLSLYRTQITDAGLEHLKALPQLNTLVLGETAVTDEGMKKFQQARPNCKIER